MLRFRRSADDVALAHSLAEMCNMPDFSLVQELLADAIASSKGPQLQEAIMDHFHIPPIDVVNPPAEYPLAHDIAVWLLQTTLNLRSTLSIPYITGDDDDDDEEEDDDWESDDWEEDDDEWDDDEDDEDDWDDDECDHDPRTKWLN